MPDCPVFVCTYCSRASCLSAVAKCPTRAAFKRPRATVTAYDRTYLEGLKLEDPEHWDTDEQTLFRSLITGELAQRTRKASVDEVHARR